MTINISTWAKPSVKPDRQHELSSLIITRKFRYCGLRWKPSGGGLFGGHDMMRGSHIQYMGVREDMPCSAGLDGVRYVDKKKSVITKCTFENAK